MKCKITAFAIGTLCFATITVAQPQFPRIAPGTAAGAVLNLGALKVLQGIDGKPAKEGPSKRELLCMDLVAFAFPESQSQDSLAQWGDSSDIFVRTFYSEEGLPHLRTQRLSRWGLSDHASTCRDDMHFCSGDRSRGVARLDRARRKIQEQSRALYNLCKTPLDPSK